MKLVLLLIVSLYAVFADDNTVFAEDNQLMQALNAQAHMSKWEDFKKTFQKTYKSTEEEISKFKIFVSHSIKVGKHNAEEALDGRHGFTTGINQFADMTTGEFAEMVNGYTPKPRNAETPTFLAPENVDLPKTVDWRTKGYVTGVKNQGQCGSCWAFSATGSLEGQHFKKTGKLVSLSEKNLMDCSGSFGNMGCNGGLMDQAFDYIKANGGIDTEASYPYVPKDGTCKFNKKNIGATVTGHVDILSKNETDLLHAVATVGPIAVAIDASNWSFQMYKRGVYNERACSQDQLDHGVLAVGYGTVGKNDYWLVKNSWAATWGMDGYIRMSRNKNNQCGIATAASYPLV